MNDLSVSGNNKFIIYQVEDGITRIQVRFDDSTIWLTQSQMVELFQTTKQNISLHLKNIFEDGELKAEATVKKYLKARIEGSRRVVRLIEHYNLDAIISVGNRVQSHRGAQFRQWATGVLSECD